MNAKGDLAECTFPKQFDELIEVEGRVGDLSTLLDIGCNVFDELFSIICH